MRALLLDVLLLIVTAGEQPSVELVVRIGLNQNAASVTVKSTEAFTVEGRATRSATFASVVAIGPASSGAVAASAVQYRTTVTLDGGAMLVMPAGGRVRIEPPGAPLEIETRAYRGTLEIFGNIRHPLTVAKLERFKGRYGLETQEAVKGSLEVATQILKAYKSGATLQILDPATSVGVFDGSFSSRR